MNGGYLYKLFIAKINTNLIKYKPLKIKIMEKGISLHIGLNYVDPKHYAGWNGELVAAEFDAEDMYLIAKSQEFQSTKLLRNEATRDAVISAIKRAATTLKPNDLFIITYSGHGGQLPDINGDEEDGLDETWCLFDGELVDDELSDLWSTFQSGTRIFVLSDSCHSGTMTREVRIREEVKNKLGEKVMPSEIASSTYYHNKEFYDKILTNVKDVDSQNIKASVKLISGCQDNQSSYDGPFNGQFTGALKRIWNGGKFNGNYFQFYKQIISLMPSNQTPKYYNIGAPNLTFDNQKPFSI